MPILQYLFGVGGALLCLMFVLNAYVPQTAPREQHELDTSIIHVTAPPSGDFVIDHFPAVRGDLATASSEAVRQAMAMMPPEEARQPGSTDTHTNPAPTPRKHHLAQRPPSRLAAGDAPLSAGGQPPSNSGWSNSGWSNNGWSQGWNNSQGNSGGSWNNSWPQNRGNNRWADSQ